MKLECPGCKVKGTIDIETVPRGAKLKCPKCGIFFTLPTEVEAKRKAPAARQAAPARPDDPAERKKHLKERREEVYDLFGRNGDAEAPPAAPTDTSVVTRPKFHGKGETLFGIHIVNIILSILTLGVYHFWGKVKIRNYLYGHTEFLGERFAYHGTGRELLVGWLKAMVIIGGGFALIQYLSTLHPAFILLVYPAFIVILPLAMVATMRYRMSRTSLHGIRFSFRGGVKEAIWLNIKGAFLIVFTFGLYAPYFHAYMQRYWRTKSRFGNAALGYDGTGRGIIGPYVIALFLGPFTLWFLWFWYLALQRRYDWERTTLEGLRFRSTISGWGLFVLKLGNLFLLVLSLGLARPWVVIRNLNFELDHLTIIGALELEKIRQEAHDAGAVGEGFMDLMDMDWGFF